MKFGLVSAILDGWTMEEMLDVVSGMGFECVEVACWPQGKQSAVTPVSAISMLPV